MQPVTADCCYRKIFFHKVKLTKFYHVQPIATRHQIKIITNDQGINLVWEISRSCKFSPGKPTEFSLNKINLRNDSECNIVANYVISVSNEGEGILLEGTFDLKVSESSEHKLKSVSCSRHQKFDVNITVFSETESMSNIVEDYVKFLKSDQPGDVNFILGTEEVHQAQKHILSARSEVFAKMFETDMLEKKTGHVIIEDIEPDVFKLLMDFVYYGKIGTSDAKMLIKLITAANKYALNSLVKDCGYLISNKLSIDTAVDTLIVADLLNLADLKKLSMNFIADKKKEVIATEAYKKLKQKNLKNLSYELFEFLVENH